MVRLAALIAVIGVALGLAGLAGRLPAALSADAPAKVFSAARAQADIEVIAREPHPIGSAANARVRDYILQRMAASGLETQVQTQFSLRRATSRTSDPVFLGGPVENIIGVFPGRDRSAPALALMAHYDSVRHSPGAADNAAGVAAALEVARVLRAHGTPERDVVFLMTDGEEAGLLGAEAFFDSHPLAGRIGFLVNMEARGGGGLAQMFQTASRNRGAIDLLQSVAHHPSASSLSVLVYSVMPNDTDFTVSRAAGIDGLNFAFIGRQFDYHAPTSTPGNLDAGSLQHMGDQVTAIALAAALSASLPTRGPDQTFSHTFNDLLIAYPPLAGWLVLAACAGLLALALRNARRSGVLDAPGVIRGAGAAVYLVLFTGAVLHLARRIASDGRGFLEQRDLLARVTVWEIAILLIGLGALLLTIRMSSSGRSRLQACALALAAGAGALVFGWDPAAVALGTAAGVAGIMTFGPPVRVAPAWTGVLLTGFAAALLLQLLVPTAAFLVAWPLLAACLLAVLTTLGAGAPAWRLPVASLLVGAPVAAWLLGYAHGVFLGLDLPAVLTVFVWLASLVLWPLAHGDPAGKVGRSRAVFWLGRGSAACLIGGLVVAGTLRATPPWSERFPEATLVQHLYDSDTGKAFLISSEPRLSPWTRQVLTQQGLPPERIRDDLVGRRPVWSAPAPAEPLEATGMSVETLPDGRRRLIIRPPADAGRLDIRIRCNTPWAGAAINGRPADLLSAPGVWNRVRIAAPPGELVIDFMPAGPGTLEVLSMTQTTGWPRALRPLPARKTDEMAFGDSDTALVKARRNFNW
jgi:hypothetical protein